MTHLTQNASALATLCNLKRFDKMSKSILAEVEDVDYQFKVNTYNFSFAAYTYSQRLLSCFVEIFLDSNKFKPHSKILGKAVDEYQPEGPPISPLTRSYFNYWLIYDYQFEARVSFADLILKEKGRFEILESETLLREAIECAARSRMGIYEHLGVKGNTIILQELVTNKQISGICPAGYLGEPGELWYVRYMPAVANDECGVIATTPYILVGHVKEEWLAFFQRQKAFSDNGVHDLMKYGPNTFYWHEFIFEAYLGMAPEGNRIVLQGIPDINGTRPHQG